MGQCSSRRNTPRATQKELPPDKIYALMETPDVNGRIAKCLPDHVLAGFRAASRRYKAIVDMAMTNEWGKGYTITKLAEMGRKLGKAVPVPPRPNAIATDAELVEDQIDVPGVAVQFWDTNGSEAAAVEALWREKDNNHRGGISRQGMKDPRHAVPRIKEAHPPPTALEFATTIKDMIVGADGGAMRLNEVSAAYDATRTEGAFDAHLAQVHEDPTWYPKTGLSQHILEKASLVIGLLKYFNSSVPEIEVLVLREVGGAHTKKEIKLDDFSGTMKSLCKGKKNKVGANNLKRTIKFRRV